MHSALSDPIPSQISMMNQRGGRPLSLVDLIEAGTLSPALAAILAFTPQGVEIVTVDRTSAPPFSLRPSGSKRVYLSHKISSRAYYSYLMLKLDGNGFERFSEPTPLEEEILGFFRRLIGRKVRRFGEVRRSFLLAAASLAAGAGWRGV